MSLIYFMLAYNNNLNFKINNKFYDKGKSN